MGRGGRGGRSPTPNDDRSRSMNRQDPVGQAAIDNRANQLNDQHDAYHSSRRGSGRRDDDDFDDDYDDGIFEEVGEEPNQDTEKGIYFGEISREESEKPQEPKPTRARIHMCSIYFCLGVNEVVTYAPKNLFTDILFKKQVVNYRAHLGSIRQRARANLNLQNFAIKNL